MPNQYVIYWEPSNLDDLGEKMQRASSNHYKKLSVGDTVYFVTKEAGDFLLLGKIAVGMVTDSRKEVADFLGCKEDDLNFYEEPDWHIVADPKEAFTMKALPAEELLEQIMVKSGGKVQKIKTPLSHHSFRSPRLLTAGSVNWLDAYLETEEIPKLAISARKVQEKRKEEEQERERKRTEELEGSSEGWFATVTGAIKSLFRGNRRQRIPTPPPGKRNKVYRRR